VLKHYGRRSGKAYTLKVWFVELGDHIWVGTQDRTRNWARNLRANHRAELDFGAGPRAYTSRDAGDEAELARFRAAILAKHPVTARIIVWLSRGKIPCCFELTPANGADHTP